MPQNLTKYSNIIYALKGNDNVVRYVGMSSVGLSRPKQHLMKSHYLDPKKSHFHVYNWVRKCISEGYSPIIEVLEECESREVLVERETFWINKFQNDGIKLVNTIKSREIGKNPHQRAVIDNNGKIYESIAAVARFFGASLNSIKKPMSKGHVGSKYFVRYVGTDMPILKKKTNKPVFLDGIVYSGAREAHRKTGIGRQYLLSILKNKRKSRKHVAYYIAEETNADK